MQKDLPEKLLTSWLTRLLAYEITTKIINGGLRKAENNKFKNPSRCVRIYPKSSVKVHNGQ